ncbi:YtfJ family protein [Rosenbergiella australiborealis]|uniref:YtfJ family protein n=1 Tax=Rosenbergiella australiborealis TaxID=1544696 RepID=A0ABS5T4B7_9GAMM|nr:YtfJ family protein [Rosenbergiella australiborealis]MBT0727166.1 YtfJ family protein [Rosenbergiella australiborealis]
MARIKKGKGLLLSLLFLASNIYAQSIQLGSPLPEVAIENGGEVHSDGAVTTLQPWHSALRQAGTRQLIIHVAGRLSAKQQLSGLIALLPQAQLSLYHVHTTTIVNLDDSIWGSGPFVEQSIMSSKKHQPENSFVIDKSGIAAHRWQLLAQSAAIIATDPQGKVIFFHQGECLAWCRQQLFGMLEQ